MRILIIDDEPSIRRTLRVALEAASHTVVEVSDRSAALAAVERHPFEVIFVDVRLGAASGLDLVAPLLEQMPAAAIVIITAHASLDTAIDAMRKGAIDYLPKPFTPAQVRAVLERVSRMRSLRNRLARLEDLVADVVPDVDLRTLDPQMSRVLEMVRKVGPSDVAVLLRGESGTGKGVVARALHAASPRAAAPFVTVSCPSLNAELLESDLFGHARGAFTGAVRDTAGKAAAAEGGSLFLDEVGDLPASLQPKLLRFLQDRAYERVGETKTRTADVRLIAATNRDLEAAVALGQFREDLLYRLNVVEISLPPLRARTDLLALADRLLTTFARQTARPLTGFSQEAREALARHTWPGNLRELRNAIERAVILAEGPLVGTADLPERVVQSHSGPLDASNSADLGAPVSLERLEVEHIRRILARSASLEEAAATLGIDPSTLYRKRKQHGL
jgi:NtrC-family two-component system response regulator AlgB